MAYLHILISYIHKYFRRCKLRIRYFEADNNVLKNVNLQLKHSFCNTHKFGF